MAEPSEDSTGRSTYLEEYDVGPEEQECVVRRVVLVFDVVWNEVQISDVVEVTLPQPRTCWKHHERFLHHNCCCGNGIRNECHLTRCTTPCF